MEVVQQSTLVPSSLLLGNYDNNQQQISISSPESSEGDSLHSQGNTYKVGKMKLDFKNEDDRKKKRQVRLEKNRKSAALSRHRKKEYITNLEAKAQELRLSTQEIQLTFSQLSNNQMDTVKLLERLDKQLNNVLNENDLLKKKIHQFINPNQPPLITNNNNNNINSNINNNININNINIKPFNQSPIIVSNLNSANYDGIIKRKDSSSSSDIVIGANKLGHLYNSNNNSKCNINDNTEINNNSNNNSNNNDSPKILNSIFNNNLSISNPNVNSSPTYLTRARSSSYHPNSNSNIGNTSLSTNETLIAEALSNLTNISYNPQSPIIQNISKETNGNSNDSSPILPSLSLITKNLGVVGGNSPSISSPTISSPLGLLSLSPIQSPIISHSRSQSKKNPLLVNLSTNLPQNIN